MAATQPQVGVRPGPDGSAPDSRQRGANRDSRLWQSVEKLRMRLDVLRARFLFGVLPLPSKTRAQAEKAPLPPKTLSDIVSWKGHSEIPVEAATAKD
jgi:hypothetical protein